MRECFISIRNGSANLIVILFWILSSSLTPKSAHTRPADETRLSYSVRFDKLYADIAGELISPDSASLVFQHLIADIRASFKDGVSCETIVDSTYFIYPLRGYTAVASVGGRGRGYRPKGFDLFDNRVRGSHPAHDLFIKDRDHDNIDDVKCLPVDVLAFTHGLVLSVESDWESDTLRRGGNFVWIYDPCLDGLFYYAHNSCITVEPGQWVFAGQKIGEVGRTGFNARRDRSPTHLHLMFLKLTPEGLPLPFNTYDWLKQSAMRGWEDESPGPSSPSSDF